eukprot:3469775-Pyramimonas_sp.AAC.1
MGAPCGGLVLTVTDEALGTTIYVHRARGMPGEPWGANGGLPRSEGQNLACSFLGKMRPASTRALRAK